MAKITVIRFLLLLMVLELTLVLSAEGKAWWKRRRRRCSSTRPTGVAWVNQWQQHYFTYSCSNRFSLSRWYSIHRNCKEDRIHYFQCRYGPVAYHAGNCWWTNHYVNDYDRPVAFKCHNNGFLTGVRSEYSGPHKDRRFGFRCCQKPGYYQHFCKLTPILNVWDGVLDYNVPYGYSLVGVHSYHDNHYEDRRWKFEICKITKP
ncbi:hypothetical protein ABFA07_017620 [Porites harrisoni]